MGTSKWNMAVHAYGRNEKLISELKKECGAHKWT